MLLRISFPAVCAVLFLFSLSNNTALASSPVTFTAGIEPAVIHPGEALTVTVHAAVQSGWHLYSVHGSSDGPSPTGIQAASGYLPDGDTTEDRPITKFDANFGEMVSYHMLSGVFQRRFIVPKSAKLGEVPLPIVVHYQVCNDRICLPPTNITLPGAVQVEPGPIRSAYTPGAGKTDAGLGHGILFFLCAAAAAGLLALLTPCVFPLIPITLTSFAKESGGDRSKLLKLSSAFAAGIVILYLTVGIGATTILGAAGVNRIAANPWVNVILFVLFVTFALSFFESIQLRLPANLGGLQKAAHDRGGRAGLVLLGVSFVLASFTCTAPFLGTLLIAAAGGAVLRPLLGMLAFSAAFASPFVVFAVAPQWITRIPKSGLWMVRLKATLGFIELGAALKFLSNADLVWQWHVLTQPVLLSLWALTATAAGLYLLGAIRFGAVADIGGGFLRQVTPIAGGAAALFIAFAAYCVFGVAGSPLNPYLEAYLPPAGYGAIGGADRSGLTWQSDYTVAMAQAKAENKPLLIDFTGYTCTNCRLNEKSIFPLPSVQKRLNRFVRVQLYTDGGPNGQANQALEASRFGDVALPLYGVVNPATGAVISQTAGVQTEAGFDSFLNAAAQPSFSPTTMSGQIWSEYYPDALPHQGHPGKPAIIDFTADWCVNCKAMERSVLQDPSVNGVLGSKFVMLKSDLTQWTSPTSLSIEKQYGIASLPTIIFLDSSGQEIRSLRVTSRISLSDFEHRLTVAGQS